MTYDHRLDLLEISIDDSYKYRFDIDMLIKNDGLTRKQFVNWFFPEGTEEFSGQIIHWTDFKY